MTTQATPPVAPAAPVSAPTPAPVTSTAPPANPAPVAPAAPAAPIVTTPSPAPVAPPANPAPAPSSSDGDIRAQLAEVKKMLADAEAARLAAEQKAADAANKAIEAKLAPKMAQLTVEQKAVVEKLPLDQREAFLGAFLTSANPPAPPAPAPAPAQNATLTALEVVNSPTKENYAAFKKQNPNDWSQKISNVAQNTPRSSFAQALQLVK